MFTIQRDFTNSVGASVSTIEYFAGYYSALLAFHAALKSNPNNTKLSLNEYPKRGEPRTLREAMGSCMLCFWYR